MLNDFFDRPSDPGCCSYESDGTIKVDCILLHADGLLTRIKKHCYPACSVDRGQSSGTIIERPRKHESN